MDTTITPPFVLDMPGDVSVYASLDGFKRHIEPWFLDVHDPPVCDATGRLLRIVFDGSSPTGNTLVPLEREPTHSAEVRRLLLKFLKGISPSPDVEKKSLNELFALAKPYAEDVYRG